MVYSLLSMLGTHDKDDMSRTLLAMSSSQDSCIAMRESGKSIQTSEGLCLSGSFYLIKTAVFVYVRKASRQSVGQFRVVFKHGYICDIYTYMHVFKRACVRSERS